MRKPKPLEPWVKQTGEVQAPGWQETDYGMVRVIRTRAPGYVFKQPSPLTKGDLGAAAMPRGERWDLLRRRLLPIFHDLLKIWPALPEHHQTEGRRIQDGILNTLKEAADGNLEVAAWLSFLVGESWGRFAERVHWEPLVRDRRIREAKRPKWKSDGWKAVETEFYRNPKLTPAQAELVFKKHDAQFPTTFRHDFCARRSIWKKRPGLED